MGVLLLPTLGLGGQDGAGPRVRGRWGAVGQLRSSGRGWGELPVAFPLAALPSWCQSPCPGSSPNPEAPDLDGSFVTTTQTHRLAGNPHNPLPIFHVNRRPFSPQAVTTS